METGEQVRFQSIEAVQKGFDAVGYVCSPRIATTLCLAHHLQKPILVEVPAGAGKTELAKAAAAYLERPLIRLEYYEGVDESKALYEWKYGKQLLYTQILKDKLDGLIEGAHGLAEAMDRVQKGTGLGVDLGRPDYGQILRDLEAGWMDTIGRKTTVLILGDARNNYGAPEIGILRRIHQMAKRVIWLNPEAPPFWGIGDSEMARYLPFCTLAREYSSVNHLERAVGFLVRNG